MKERVPRGWYYGVICSNCGLPVYCLEDKHEGREPVRFNEPGLFKFGCENCSQQDLYHTSDIQILRAP
jgi:hypothetical protein